MLLLIYSLISKERRIIIGKASVDDEIRAGEVRVYTHSSVFNKLKRE